MAQEFSHIEVAVALPLFTTFTYAVPEPLRDLAAPGKRVLVPFGRRKITGYVLGPAGETEVDGIRDILAVLDETPLFPETMIPFFRWLADYYIHPLGEVIAEALPGGINLTDGVMLEATEAGKACRQNPSTDPLTAGILSLTSEKPCHLKEVSRKLGREIPDGFLRQMEKNDLIRRRRGLKKPAVREKTQARVRLAAPGGGFDGLSAPKRRILEALRENGEMAVAELKSIVPTAGQHLRRLEKAGWIACLSRPVYRDPFGDPVAPDQPPKLTLDQRHVVSQVVRKLGQGFKTFLLSGVTGSGKTEVYLHIAAKALEKQLSVLVLVPEIALVSEIERRFRARFGDCVAVLHSGLSAGERLDQWLRIANGACAIAIGARSALFAPLCGIGLIIVDEEHDTSYKQESRFRYNARDMAILRGRQAGAAVLLGSATPSVQSIYNIATRKFTELRLEKRVFSQTLPAIEVVDLRKHKGFRGIRRFITMDLQNAIKDTLARREQVLLFLNRRGFASYPVCADCGEPLKCRHCDITLTLHQKENVYKCHLCGYSLPAAAVCGACGSVNIKRLGLGTEKIEETLKALFPEAQVARMDRDTVTRKGALVGLLKGLRNHAIDILIGTQMVAKGHDFPGITLVGIICADLSLSFPDFRAGELTFQVLAQVAGRAGRGDRPGRVILQTYSPDHFSITAATDHDVMKFYHQEIAFRKAFRYPPFARMIQIKISGRDKEKTRDQAMAVGGMGEALKQSDPAFGERVETLGPIEAPLSRVADRYRWQLLVKSEDAALLHRFVRSLIFGNGLHLSGRPARVDVDVDPFFMM